MNVVGRTCWLLGCGVVLLGGVAAGQVPTYSVELAAIDGVPVSPPQANVEVEPGDVLTVEIFLRNWSVGGVPLKAYQFALNPAGFTSGDQGNINPKDYATTTQVPVPCGSTDTDGPENTANAFITTTRADYVYNGLTVHSKVGTRRCGYRYGGAVQVGAPTSVPGVKKYVGTVILLVSADARGAFSLGLDPNSERTLLRSGFTTTPIPITPFALESLELTVVPQVDLDIVAAFPPNNAVDARQPSNLDGSGPTGFTSVALTFDKPAANLMTSDFTITVVPAGGAPTVSNVMPNGNKVTVGFSTFIPPQKWTTITHNDTTPTNTRLGYLPGDVDNNRMSTALDALELIDALDGVVVLQPYQTDLNRSNGTTVIDLMTEMDLLNGAGAFIVWNGRTLP